MSQPHQKGPCSRCAYCLPSMAVMLCWSEDTTRPPCQRSRSLGIGKEGATQAHHLAAVVIVPAVVSAATTGAHVLAGSALLREVREVVPEQLKALFHTFKSRSPRMLP